MVWSEGYFGNNLLFSIPFVDVKTLSINIQNTISQHNPCVLEEDFVFFLHVQEAAYMYKGLFVKSWNMEAESGIPIA